jgi:hypothetical protein
MDVEFMMVGGWLFFMQGVAKHICTCPAFNSQVTMSGEDDSSGWHLTESDPGVFTYVPIFLLSGPLIL